MHLPALREHSEDREGLGGIVASLVIHCGVFLLMAMAPLAAHPPQPLPLGVVMMDLQGLALPGGGGGGGAAPAVPDSAPQPVSRPRPQAAPPATPAPVPVKPAAMVTENAAKPVAARKVAAKAAPRPEARDKSAPKSAPDRPSADQPREERTATAGQEAEFCDTVPVASASGGAPGGMAGMARGAGRGGPGSGAGAPAVGHPGGTPMADAGETQRILAALTALVERYKEYPRAARRAGYQGTVVMAVKLRSDGAIDTWNVAACSAHALLDRATEKAFARMEGVRVANVSLPGDMRVLVPVRYELN